MEIRVKQDNDRMLEEKASSTLEEIINRTKDMTEEQKNFYNSNPEMLPFWYLEQRDKTRLFNAIPIEKSWNYPHWFDPKIHSMWVDE